LQINRRANINISVIFMPSAQMATGKCGHVNMPKGKMLKPNPNPKL